MPTVVAARTPLGIYAIRATRWYKLVLEEVTESNRNQIVYSDSGPEGVPMHFRADGITLFDFPKAGRYAGGDGPAVEIGDDGARPRQLDEVESLRTDLRQRRFRYMNAFLTCFNSAFGSSHQLEPPCNPNRYIHVLRDGGLLDNGSSGIAALPIFPPLSPNVLADSARMFRSLEGDHIELGLDLTELYYRAAYHKDNLEFGTSLILSWALIERCQNILWMRYIKGGYTSVAPHAVIAGKRRDTLLTDRNYTAAIKTQILALGNVYHDQEVEWLDSTRKKRNDYMHSLGSVAHMDTFVAQQAAARLLQKVIGFEPRPFGGSSVGWEYTG
jgi:hypothetical protein